MCEPPGVPARQPCSARRRAPRSRRSPPRPPDPCGSSSTAAGPGTTWAAVVERVQRAGYGAFFVTVDMPLRGNQERVRSNERAVPPRPSVANVLRYAPQQDTAPAPLPRPPRGTVRRRLGPGDPDRRRGETGNGRPEGAGSRGRRRHDRAALPVRPGGLGLIDGGHRVGHLTSRRRPARSGGPSAPQPGGSSCPPPRPPAPAGSPVPEWRWLS